MKLYNKVALITGASSGIGEASAILFAKEGARIIGAGTNDEGGKETMANINLKGGEAIFIHTDVSKTSDIENLVNEIKSKYGKVDILINNAAAAHKMMPFESIDESLWDYIYAVNVKSIFLLIKNAAPIMKAARSGVIINLASISGLRPRSGTAAYSSSKAAVISLTKESALELAPYNIRVNCICPAVVDTPMLQKFKPQDVAMPTFKKTLIDTIPLGRILTAEEVANAALYLASDEAAMITGTQINIDGGRAI